MFKLAIAGLFLILLGAGSIYFNLKASNQNKSVSGMLGNIQKGTSIFTKIIIPGTLVLLGAMMIYGAIFVSVE